MAINLSTLLNQNSLQLCKAWVNFNGATVAIRSSYNVSSVTKNGTGDYTVNFATALADANYSIAGLAGSIAAATVIRTYDEGTARTTASFRILVFVTTGGPIDAPQVNIQVFGN